MRRVAGISTPRHRSRIDEAGAAGFWSHAPGSCRTAVPLPRSTIIAPGRDRTDFHGPDHCPLSVSASSPWITRHHHAHRDLLRPAARWPAIAISSKCCISSARKTGFIGIPVPEAVPALIGLKGRSPFGPAAPRAFWPSLLLGAPGKATAWPPRSNDQATALFGRALKKKKKITLSGAGYFGIVGIVILHKSAMTALTTRLTVIRDHPRHRPAARRSVLGRNRLTCPGFAANPTGPCRNLGVFMLHECGNRTALKTAPPQGPPKGAMRCIG